MDTPTLKAAIEQQRWDVAAHMLVYGLIKAQTDGSRAAVTNREDLDRGKQRRSARQPKRS